ncbi:MAG: hypothetical protein Q8Q73_14785 [Stagnimonas sp.]|nr:hypothetical protein [Stagnimonas sp.]
MSTNYRDYTRSLIAGIPQAIDVMGDYFQVIKAASAITLQFDAGGNKIVRREGMGGPADYRRVELLSEVDQTVTVALGTCAGLAPYDTRGTLSGVTITATQSIANALPATTDVTVPAGGTVLLAGANPDRLELRVQIPPEVDGPFRIGDAATDATHGGKFYPGAIEYLAGNAALYVHNAGAMPADLSVLELNKL